MFTGIIEGMGRLEALENEGSNTHFTFSSAFTHELKIDQSVAHNGTCLTVVALHEDGKYTVTAIDETLKKTNLGTLKPGDLVNLERCMKLGDRLDGHIVQGHVDQTAVCTAVHDEQGSWKVHFKYQEVAHVTVPKGSICVNGVSLTVVDSEPGTFSVAIIPYTWAHTNFHTLKVGTVVNLEFDIIGKYISRLMPR
jgi:riboflavin synthase